MSEFIRELLECEKEKPYAKYYSQPMAKPTAAQLAVLEKPAIAPEKLLKLEDLGKLFKQENTFEPGYGNFEDGSGIVMNEIFMPGVTAEMMQWWFAWHPLEALRYTIWDPADHHSVSICDEDRAKILNPSVPLEEKSRGVVHWVIEKLGLEADDCIIHFMNPFEMGFAPEDFHEPNITNAIGGWAHLHGRKAPMDSFATMLHTFKETEDGLIFRSRFWMGYKYIRGQVVKVLPPGIVIPEIVMKGLLKHSIEEYTNLAAILPSLYAECEGKVE